MATKNICVTGASRGIGHAITAHLLSPAVSCDVLLVARTFSPLEELQSAYPSHTSYVCGDVSSPTIAQNIVSKAVSGKGRLDGLVLNHAVLGQMGNISEANIKEWERAFTVNVTGTLRLIQAALPERRKTKGRIIFVSSGVAVVGYPTLGPYGATKFVVNHLALQLTKEEPHVMAVAVRPGMVDTEMVGEILLDERADEEFKGVRKMAIEQGTMVEADELWRVIARLALWAGEKLRGDFVSWDDKRLAESQGTALKGESG